MEKRLLTFLKSIAKNNEKTWFHANKSLFDDIHDSFKAEIQIINDLLEKSDNIDSHRVYRIYRDVRFSKDKTPYKNYFAAGFKRATAALRGGYYLEIQPNNKSIVAGGFWNPNPADLKRIKEEFNNDASSIQKITSSKKFKTYFGEIIGEGLKNVPKDYNANSPIAEILKKKQFLLIRHFSDEEVVDVKFQKEVINTFEAMRPFFDYMSYVLTTNSNGESVL